MTEDQLTEEQLRAATKLANGENAIVWWKIGEGKTRIALAWMHLILDNPKPLIVCSPQAFRQWKDEAKLLGLNLKLRFISSGILSRRDFSILDFANTNCVVVDELWMYKNPMSGPRGSNRAKHIKQITNRMPSIGLSGSLMTAGNIEDLYGQAKAMNLDKKLATSLTGFRTTFMLSMNNWAGFIQRYPKKGAVEAIQRRLYENIDIYFPKEVREIRDIEVNVEPTIEQLAVKKELKKTYAYQKDNVELELKSAITLLIKLQQVSDGFIRDSKRNCLPIKSNKMSRLIELCTELLDSGERILVWVSFRQTAYMLSRALPCKTTILSGDGKFDVFGWRNEKVRATIATVGSGSSLNDFANIRYSLFYSTSFSNINLQQAKGRTNRKSSLQNCSYYYFLATDKFPDRHIYEMIDDNKTQEEIAIQLASKVMEEK